MSLNFPGDDYNKLLLGTLFCVQYCAKVMQTKFGKFIYCIYFTRKYINDTFFFPTIIIIIFLHIVQDDDDESLRTYFLCFPFNSIFINLLIII